MQRGCAKALRLFGLVIVSFAGVGALPASALAETVFSESFGAGPTMTDRLTRNAHPSTCAVLKSFPGLSTASGVPYLTQLYINSGPARCVAFKYTGGTCDTFAFLSAYAGPFNPADKASNYLGDAGVSRIGSTLALSLAAGQDITLVMNEINGGACSFVVETAVVTATHDFNFDGKSDLAWRQNTGAAALWLLDGATLVQGAGLGTVPPAWQIVGQRDFNGDGKYDLLWRNTTTGDVAIWFLDGTTVASTASVGTIPTEWVIAGVADVNGNGTADLLWRNTSTGDVAFWLLIGGAVVDSKSLGTVPTEWSIVGWADFNGDGDADILWRNTTTGALAIWHLDGALSSPISTAIVATVPTTWSIVATGDFNGDGKPDLLWRDSSGTVAIWLMNGATISSSAGLGTVPAVWSIVETGDFDGDTKSDIVWRNTTTGQVAIWFMNGTAVTSTAPVATVGTDWTIQNVNVN